MDFIAPAIVSAGMMKTQEAVRIVVQAEADVFAAENPAAVRSEMRVAGRRKKA